MAKKSIFISFDYDNDSHYKNLLVEWDKKNEFDFVFYNGPLRDSIDSTDAAYIKSKIKPRILAASGLLFIIGKRSYASSWIDWKVQTAIIANNNLIGVKIEKDNLSPPSLLGVGTTWVMSFKFPAIKQALNESLG